MQSPPQTRLLVVAGAVLVLNLLDAIFTLLYTHVGVATESNPLMDSVLASSPVMFMATKLLLVSLGVCLLWRLRHRRTAVAGLVAAGSAYASLLIYHLSAVHHLTPSNIVAAM